MCVCVFTYKKYYMLVPVDDILSYTNFVSVLVLTHILAHAY